MLTLSYFLFSESQTANGVNEIEIPTQFSIHWAAFYCKNMRSARICIWFDSTLNMPFNAIYCEWKLCRIESELQMSNIWSVVSVCDIGFGRNQSEIMLRCFGFGWSLYFHRASGCRKLRIWQITKGSYSMLRNVRLDFADIDDDDGDDVIAVGILILHSR